mgnify:CR=1 FL=1
MMRNLIVLFFVLVFCMPLSSAVASSIDITLGDGLINAGQREKIARREGWPPKRENRAHYPVSKVKSKVYVRPECADGSFGLPVLGCWNQPVVESTGCPVGAVVNYLPGDSAQSPIQLTGVGGLPSQCRASAAPAGPVVPRAQLVLEEFRVLPLVGSGVSYQPADGMAVINLPFVAYTSGASQTLQTTILGTAVTIEATPVGFAWDYGDDSAVFKTKDPNRPYPNHAYEHVFAHVGKARVTLTTTWSGRYSLNGSTWQAIAGTTTTTEVSAPITVNEILIYNTN